VETYPLSSRVGDSRPEALPVSATGGQPGYCVVCRSSDGRVVWTAADHRARYCSCGVVYMEPRPPPGTVDLTTEKHSEGYYIHSASARLAWVQGFQPGGRLLEVGCGGGYFLRAAREAGYDVTGVDPDSRAVEYVRETLGVEVEQAFIEESTLPAEAFDVVFHVDLLSHFPDPVAGLTAMVRRVKPGGFLCFEVGGQGLLATRYYALRRSAGYPHHLWLYEPKALRVLLERAGLEVVAIRRFGLLAGVVLLTAGQIGQRIVGRRAGPAGRPRTFGQVSPIRSAWDRMQHGCRYVIGRWMPPLGPQTLWIAARKKVAGGVHPG
jgi:SAM-dependent methyltransferase